jgi:phosphatidylglycerophosphatase A
MTRFAVWLAAAGGAGYAPFASGTVGSAVGVVLYLLTRGLPDVLQVALLVAVTLGGVWAGSIAARHFGREDPGQVVIDEVAGQLLTYLLLDLTWIGVVLGFVAFRVFDIVKPWPAGRLEGLPGGWGIMADDLMAALYAWLVLAGVARFAPSFV